MSIGLSALIAMLKKTQKDISRKTVEAEVRTAVMMCIIRVHVCYYI